MASLLDWEDYFKKLSIQHVKLPITEEVLEYLKDDGSISENLEIF